MGPIPWPRSPTDIIVSEVIPTAGRCNCSSRPRRRQTLQNEVAPARVRAHICIFRHPRSCPGSLAMVTVTTALDYQYCCTSKYVDCTCLYRYIIPCVQSSSSAPSSAVLFTSVGSDCRPSTLGQVWISFTRIASRVYISRATVVGEITECLVPPSTINTPARNSAIA